LLRKAGSTGDYTPVIEGRSFGTNDGGFMRFGKGRKLTYEELNGLLDRPVLTKRRR
jgi:hypothetical protein